MIKGPFRILKWQDRNEFKFPNICICDSKNVRSNVKFLKSSHLHSDHWVILLIEANSEYFTPSINVEPNSVGK